MATADVTRSSPTTGPERRGVAARLATETKASFKTSEFFAYLITFALILIAGNAVEKTEGGRDYFTADQVWLYITILTVGYLLSRGLAKSGSRDPYWAGGTNERPEQDPDRR